MARLFGRFLAMMLALGASGLAASTASADTLQDVMSRGTLRVGLAAETFVPWTMVDHDGDQIGFEIDVARRLASDLGVEVQFVQRPFVQLIPSLLAGESDVIISGLSITTQRAKLVAFSRPYAHSEVNFLARTSGGAQVTTDSVDKEGTTIGVVGGTVSEFAAAQAFAHATVRQFQADRNLQDALLNGEIAGLVASSPIPELVMAANTDELTISEEPLLRTAEAFAVRPDSLRLLNLLDSWIYEKEAGGFLERLRAYWFDSTDWGDRLTQDETEVVE
ncbi:transporter substrate-binding domain-containing protein [Microbaculum marinum]|uniref:Transporter substrate-binding domain-containing protein n=1 Tax=Microbaculum marinum TaxID=1764581 RepID=A0AAW9RWI9_9HYPH